MANESLNIYQKLAKIRKNVEVIQKDSAGYGYKYVSEAEILSKLSIWLDKTGLLLFPQIVPGKTSAYIESIDTVKLDKKSGNPVTEKKAEALVQGEMIFTWLNIDNPEEKLEIPWAFAGQQSDVSQAFGSGLTYCTRYFLLKFFNIATTEDDPDNWRSKQKAAADEENRQIVEGLIKEVDKIAKEFVANAKDAEEARKELTTLIKKYVKNGNYNAIKEPVLASKLLEEIKALGKNNKEAEVKEEK